MDTRPPRRVRSAASMVAGLSPAESVIMYGDRLFNARNRATPTTARLPLSGRHMDVNELAFAGLCTVLGALEAAGELEITLRPRKGLVRTTDQVHVRQVRDPHDWPALSPERRLGAWLRERPEREAWLEDMITTAIVPEVTTHPHRMALGYLLAGLVKRGIVEEIERRILFLFRVTEYRVVEREAAGLLRVNERDVDESLRSHDLLGEALRDKCRSAWRGAIQLRMDTP